MTREAPVVAVVGGGILGLSAARALTRRLPNLRVIVLEKEPEIGRHQTGHASGVVHSGIYYTPGSLKARLCVQGARQLVQFCTEREIPFQRCGKVIVATSADELPRLEELHRRAIANGVEGAELIGTERLAELEPHAAGVRALHVPTTGIVDFVKVARAYADDVAAAGGSVLAGHEVTAVTPRGRGLVLTTSAGEIEASYAVACAGVYADRVARFCGGSAEPRIVPFRGDYYVLRPERRSLVNGLVYPVPDPTFPFLGIHTTLRPDGSVWLGPNAVLAFARDGYSRFHVRPRDLFETLGTRGFRRLARDHWRTGTVELVRDYSRRLFVASARKLIPDLRPADVSRGPAGIRAQAIAPDGSLVDDFVFEGAERILHVRNAPSPGATSSLPIGDTIAGMAVETFSLDS
jgi:(S)-2-hydroxyglutarate dehydrogenase